MYYWGIDPGAHGALAVFDGKKMEYICFAKHTEQEICEWMRVNAKKNKIRCCIEWLTPRPVSGCVTNFRLGVNYGLLKGLLCSLSIGYEAITPKKWQKHFRLNKKYETSVKRKNAHKQLAQQRFPNLKITHDNADAILIALYSKETS